MDTTATTGRGYSNRKCTFSDGGKNDQAGRETGRDVEGDDPNCPSGEWIG